MSKKMLKTAYPFSLADELKKNTELKLSDIEILKEWCEKQPHLPKIPDLLFTLFLHSNYYSVEAAKSTIENYYTTRTHMPEIFNSRDAFSKELRQSFKISSTVPFPGLTKEGYKVIYCQLLDTDPSLFAEIEAYKSFYMIADLLLQQIGMCSGFVFVGNAMGLTLGHVGRISPLLAKKLLYYIQEAAPIRIKGIHFLHAPPALEVLLNMVKPFMKKELVNLFKFHPTVDSLVKSLSIEMIPSDLGGKCPSTVMDLHKAEIKQLEDMRWWFLEEEECQRVDESRRVGKSKLVNELFGVEGTFKKLEID